MNTDRRCHEGVAHDSRSVGFLVVCIRGVGHGYYVARANALENNVSLYHTTAGSRQTIQYRDAPVAKNAWHTLRVDFKGTSMVALPSSDTRIDLRDTHIQGAGKAGVWTKADSVTLFDAFAYGNAGP